ncbi:flagellar basal body-associated FliL family protein [Histidinibacterium aquaticum]|uniref:Flagellar protein FliL n=1 Tax=Histidinibacterium aquaticum TaxID=2613962 RepID=A0A5J5GNJ2_9RHOB|nr:flagellar basal body-associated FliL family protein [Histidinibacterium aquaticum]KAA9009956.1 flagellar basal body-associated FliL family protein [Histidinibacterium aquaticum]
MAAGQAEMASGTTGRGRAGVVLLAGALSCAALAGGLVFGAGYDGVKAALPFGGSDETEAAGDHGSTGEGLSEAGEHGGVPGQALLQLEEMVVNVTSVGASGRLSSRFMKVNIAVVYDPEGEGGDKFEERHLFVRDAFQDYLRQLNESDLDGSIGLQRLKAELLRRARAVAGGDAPSDILIADLVIQ